MDFDIIAYKSNWTKLPILSIYISLAALVLLINGVCKAFTSKYGSFDQFLLPSEYIPCGTHNHFNILAHEAS